MNTTPRQVRPKPSLRGASPGDGEPVAPRLHGDTYADVAAREDDPAVSSSTHTAPSDRRGEEPSEDAAGGRLERLEGDT